MYKIYLNIENVSNYVRKFLLIKFYEYFRKYEYKI